METEKVIQGRCVRLQDTALIRCLLAENPSWNRTRLSRELCTRWGWRNGKGRLKDMACRTFLLKLERMGELQLPPREGIPPNALRNQKIGEIPHDQTPIENPLNALQPLRIEPFYEVHKDLALFKFLLDRYHYLGHRNCVGENLKYLVRDRWERVLACILFSSAAWKSKSRDTFIGWDQAQRRRNLYLLTNNSRFLVLPWVRVKNLASHILGAVCGRICSDWTHKYGHPIHVLETFVERRRFRGTCYRAAGWIHVGVTTGRSRNDSDQTLSVPVKDIYLYPLSADFRRRLSE